MPRLLEEFPPVATEAWEAAIHADLKGADYDKRLVWHTDEGIAVRPYYRSAPGAGPAVAKETNEWEILDAPPHADVDAARFDEMGATVVQELGCALAEGIEFFAAGRPSEITFSFAIGSSYFFQIAKLRAFRLLWRRALEAFGSPEIRTRIHCRSSRWNKSIYDASNNILRATTEAMAAAIGGADSISVEPWDATFKAPGEASLRLARNTQLILKHEAYLDRVVDPAAGCYYIEALTGSLASEAWKLMQRIEEFGGCVKACQAGMIPAEIAEARAAKEAAIAQRRRIFVGVNQYPNTDERMLDRFQPHETYDVRKAPEVFEDIRLRTEQAVRRPVFLLAEFGDVKMRKARSQFSANLFGCGGFQVIARFFDDVAAIARESADAIVLCSSDAEYPDAVALLARLGVKTPLIVAGYPKDSVDLLRKLGVADFIHIRSNAAETLAAWQQRLTS